ncbi:MAG TPA: hypothetical protein VIM11_19395 [Tepidisphaeraceae bacterium]|jgi:hypothetical protein
MPGIFSVHAAFFGLLQSVCVLAADAPRPLTDPIARKQVVQAIENSSQFADIVKDKSRLITSTVVHYHETLPGTRSESEIAESLHFDYATGKTIDTVYNVTQKQIVKVEAKEAYPTPLADEEVSKAKSLAAEKDDHVKALLQKYPGREQLNVQAIAPVISDRSDKRFGKRLAILMFVPKAKLGDAVSVTVNLTDGTVAHE